MLTDIKTILKIRLKLDPGISLKSETEHCTGYEALYFAACDSDVSLIVGVPGYPITSLMDLFSKKQNPPVYRAQWLTNEKVAMETALGASISGQRALVLVKHVGMNLLSDPLITSVTHTIGAGLVVIAGDDPGVKGSQNEQDSRWYGRIAEIAVFDPSNCDSAYRALRRAFELSEETKTPVILRITAGLEKSIGNLERLPRSFAPHPRFDRSVWEYRTMEKHQVFHSKVYPFLEAEAENTDLNKITSWAVKERKIGFGPEQRSERPENGYTHPESVMSALRTNRIGIISSGFVSSIVEELLKKQDFGCEISHLSINLVNPLPLGKIGMFLRNNQKVLVVEESEPFIEEQIHIAGQVYGKKTGHLPYGQVKLEDIEFALEHINQEKVLYSELADAVLIKREIESRATICNNCPYLPLYRFLNTLDVPVAGDMGCSIRSAPEPLAAVDVGFALGSAISVACGFENKGVAVIGDFAMAHSGILGLINAATSGCNVLVLVLQNEIAAMTGGQEVPDLKKVVEAIIPDVSTFDIDEIEKWIPHPKLSDLNPKLSELIRTKIALPGVSVIFIKGKCRKN